MIKKILKLYNWKLIIAIFVLRKCIFAATRVGTSSRLHRMHSVNLSHGRNSSFHSLDICLASFSSFRLHFAKVSTTFMRSAFHRTLTLISVKIIIKYFQSHRVRSTWMTWTPVVEQKMTQMTSSRFKWGWQLIRLPFGAPLSLQISAHFYLHIVNGLLAVPHGYFSEPMPYHLR